MQTLLADGGPTANRVLMQLQADTSGRRVLVARARELSALGVAHLAGIGAGYWDRSALEALDRAGEDYAPAEAEPSRRRRIGHWHAAVARARARAPSEELAPHDGLTLEAADATQSERLHSVVNIYAGRGGEAHEVRSWAVDVRAVRRSLRDRRVRPRGQHAGSHRERGRRRRPRGARRQLSVLGPGHHRRRCRSRAAGRRAARDHDHPAHLHARVRARRADQPRSGRAPARAADLRGGRRRRQAARRADREALARPGRLRLPLPGRLPRAVEARRRRRAHRRRDGRRRPRRDRVQGQGAAHAPELVDGGAHPARHRADRPRRRRHRHGPRPLAVRQGGARRRAVARARARPPLHDRGQRQLARVGRRPHRRLDPPHRDARVLPRGPQDRLGRADLPRPVPLPRGPRRGRAHEHQHDPRDRRGARPPRPRRAQGRPGRPGRAGRPAHPHRAAARPGARSRDERRRRREPARPPAPQGQRPR